MMTKLVKKLIFCNTKKASNTEGYEAVRKRLNVEYNKASGSDLPFQVQRMRNKFKSCISICEQICMKMKTASGIERFVEERGCGKWFDLLYALVKTRDSCQPENACEPSAHMEMKTGRKLAQMRKLKMMMMQVPYLTLGIVAVKFQLTENVSQ